MDNIKELGTFYKKEATNLSMIKSKVRIRCNVVINAFNHYTIYSSNIDECKSIYQQINTYLEQNILQISGKKSDHYICVIMNDSHDANITELKSYLVNITKQDIINLNKFLKNILCKYDYHDFDKILYEKRDKSHEYTNEEFDNLCFETFGITYC